MAKFAWPVNLPFQLGHVTFKIKGEGRGAFETGRGVEQSFQNRARSLINVLPGKVTVEVGAVWQSLWEGGFGVDIKPAPTFNSWAWKRLAVEPIFYGSKKAPGNVLIDATTVKFGKLSARRMLISIRRSLAVARSRPLGPRGPQAPMSTVEPSLSIEKGWQFGPLTLLVNGAGKTTLGDLDKALIPAVPFGGFAKATGRTVGTALRDRLTGQASPTPHVDLDDALPPTPVSGFARAVGFTVGTATSRLGWNVTDGLIGQDIGNQTVRKVVDGFGAGMTGVLVDSLSQRIAEGAIRWVADEASRRIEASPAGSALSDIARRARVVLDGAVHAGRQFWQSGVERVVNNVPALTRGSPVLGDFSNIVGRIGAAGKALGGVLRIGGPAGAVLAGGDDGWDAVQAFWHDGIGSSRGWQSAGKGTLRVALTAGGAAFGAALAIAGAEAAAVAAPIVVPFLLVGLTAAAVSVAGSVCGRLLADRIIDQF